MKRSASPVALIAELVCTVALCLPGAASAASGWEKPAEIGGGSEPDVALTGGGGAAAVWEAEVGDKFVIEGAIRVAGEWKFESTIAAEAFEPSIAALGEGEALAVWAGAGVEAAMATTSGWTSLPPIPHSAGAFAPEVATDADGTATVVWRQPGPGGATIDVATRGPSGGWSAAKRLSRPGRVAYSPHLAVGPRAAAVVVWRRNDGDKSIVQATVRDSSGHWSPPVNLSAAGENAISPAVAIDRSGEAVAVWDRFDGAHQIIQASAHVAGGRWSRPVDLSAAGRNAEEPKVALSSTDEAVAVWERFDGRVDRIQAATRGSDGAWSAPKPLSSPAGSAHDPGLASDQDGLVRAVWTATENRGAAVEEASLPAGGRWSSSVRIAGGPGGREEPTVAVAAGAEAVVLWAGSEIGSAFHPASPPSP